MPLASPTSAVDGVVARVRRPASGGAAALPDVTVVVCTYRRSESLRRFLRSLVAQGDAPAALLIVDASGDDRSERVVGEEVDGIPPACAVEYLRVADAWRGLTRQRNLALHRVTTELVAFFDDDIVLLDGCLRAMWAVHRHSTRPVVGVGARLVNETASPSLRWRVRHWLGVVPSLHPGRYTRAGLSVPWGLLPDTADAVEGDWLPGGAVMWRTEEARALGFGEEFVGYGNGEDLEFSLRARERGTLLLAGGARLLHLHDGNGRPAPFELGYSTVRNAHDTHRRHLADRSWRDAARFLYGQALDLFWDAAGVLRGPERGWRLRHLAGRAGAVLAIAAGRGRRG